ncbi:GMP synthase-like glutamine amidotransferase [Actinomadura pelletieri DSM 43383]|uniref:GMP synthase-like glutamine amidotransferase n=1 Tax=Actinomadura pelletieri DSM 43383 TaxID=1120940 RepID=A0A495QUW7_9ACTN|nr:type 1 glutamine amidotransferase [Actinomadura pelletieri]RKS77241.1 GMP synthase-like glutamine amidotransferase [Actinomadura pelletieri DSM 43383]
MRALIVQHDHVSPPGPVGERLVARGFEITELLVVPEERHHTPDVRCDFPDPREWDLIVPMGAPWSVYDPKVASWVGPELAMLASAHEAGVPVLGICFGGQALAAALGGRVERAPRAEMGWVEIETDDPELVAPGPWFHFHYDRWILPPGAVEIARDEVCSQAFVLGRSMGVQFHPEITPDEFGLWMAHGGDPHMRAEGVDPDELMVEVKRTEAESARRTHTLIDAFLDRVAWRTPR